MDIKQSLHHRLLHDRSIHQALNSVWTEIGIWYLGSWLLIPRKLRRSHIATVLVVHNIREIGSNMCSCSTEQVFAWAGALLVNGAFISVIAWGAFTTWYIGFSICFVYTVLLFVSARAVDRRSAWDTVAPAEEQVQRGGDTGQQEETDAIVAEAASSDQMAGSSLITERRMPVMANFLYG